MIEIERKFLVRSATYRELASETKTIAQGYLSTHPERTVRIRISGESGFLTIKGPGNDSGTTRLEWETELSLQDAKPLMGLCEPGKIEKTRHLVPLGHHLFEVDEFHGDNEGLVLAELELHSEDEAYQKPDWLGVEVTGDVRYYNAYLSKNPYKNWPK